ncbi:MAG: hypothetical protein AAFV29_11645 [Myxococcota bacterium]
MNADVLAEWLKQRLRDSQDDWSRLFAAMYRHFLTLPVDQVIDRDALKTAVEAQLSPERMEDFIRAAFTVGVRPAVEEGRADDAPVGRWMPDDAQQQLVAFAGQKELIDPRWIEELFAQEAAEELVADTLYQSLKDFSTLVPRILQKVLPSGLGRLAGFAASAGGKVFDEVERVLDGEIRRFVEKGTRKALDRAASFASQNLDSPTAAQARQNLVRSALDKTGRFHVDRLTDARIDALQAMAQATGVYMVQRDEWAEVIDRVVDRAWTQTENKTVAEVLEAVGVQQEPPLDAWAAATWPLLRAALDAPEVDRWVDELAQQFFESTATSAES